jgi:hypothetical protein
VTCPNCKTAELKGGREGVCQACALTGAKAELKTERAKRPTYQVSMPYMMSLPYSIADLADHELSEPLPARVRKVLEQAQENGWVLNGKGLTMAIRLDKPDDPDAVPFCALWTWTLGDKGKGSWRFSGACAANWQPMNFADIFTVLEDPSRIWPEETGDCE